MGSEDAGCATKAPGLRPLVSVLLPARDAEGCIARAVSGVLAQDLPDWELLVVDDGSSDATAERARQAAGGDPRVRVLRTGRRGLVTALHAGLAAARGRLIARLDADDEVAPDRLSSQVALLDARPDVGVASCLVAFGGDRATARGYALHVDWINGLREPEEIAGQRFVESPLAHPSVLFRRELAQRHGAWAEGPFPEDYELWLRWMDAGVRCAKVPRVLLTWHDPPGRLSRTDPRYAPEAFYATKCRWLARAVPAGRPLWLWGAGRVTRRRFAALERLAGPFAGFVDIDPRKRGSAPGGRPVVAPQDIPRSAFVVAGVGSRGARERIDAALRDGGRRPGTDYWLAA